MPRREPACSRSPATCTASSRVGVTARACGLPAYAKSAQASSTGDTALLRIGIPKPSVLPVPVLAWPMMSWRSRATGSVIDWMGNGEVMPLSARAATMSGWMEKSENEVWASVMGLS